MDNLKKMTEEGLFDFLFEFSNNETGSLLNSGNLKYVVSDIPKFCNVFGTVFPDNELSNEIIRIIHLFKSTGSPFFWITGPGTKPDHTSPVLIDNGLVDAGTTYGLIIKLPATRDRVTGNRNFIIKEVADIHDLNVWIERVKGMFHFSGNQPHILTEILKKKVFLEKKFRLFLGLVDNETVSTGALHYGKSTAGCYWISTLNPLRRKGFATDMMRHLMVTAGNSGFPYLSLQSNRDAYGLYKKLGFTHCCDFRFHLLS